MKLIVNKKKLVNLSKDLKIMSIGQTAKVAGGEIPDGLTDCDIQGRNNRVLTIIIKPKP